VIKKPRTKEKMLTGGILHTIWWLISLTLIYYSALMPPPYNKIMIVIGFLMNGLILFEYFKLVGQNKK